MTFDADLPHHFENPGPDGGRAARGSQRGPAKELISHAKDPVRQDLGRPRGRSRPDLHRPAPRPRGDQPAGVRRPPARRAQGSPARPDAGDRRPQRAHRRDAGRRAHPRRALARPGADARAQLRGVRDPAVLAGLRASGDRARDRARAGRHAARDDDRLRRLAHRDPRRVRGAGVRDRHQRGRARARHPVPGAVQAPLDADPLRGLARLRRHRQGPDPRHDRPDGRRRRGGPRRRVRRARDRGAVDGGPDDRLQHDDRGRWPGRDDRARRDDVRVGDRTTRGTGGGPGALARRCRPTTARRSTARSRSTRPRSARW